MDVEHIEDWKILSRNLGTLPTYQTTSNHTISAVNSQSFTRALTVANIECLTASKASILSEICLCLQETHRPTNLLLTENIDGMLLVAERPHNQYDSDLLIRDDLKVENVYERVQGTVELITIVMPGVVVHYVYKPPNDQHSAT